MEKINFNQVRGFSDSITLTFNFIKQEFKPLLRSFAVIALPVIFIGLFFMSYSARECLRSYSLINTPDRRSIC